MFSISISISISPGLSLTLSGFIVIRSVAIVRPLGRSLAWRREMGWMARTASRDRPRKFRHVYQSSIEPLKRPELLEPREIVCSQSLHWFKHSLRTDFCATYLRTTTHGSRLPDIGAISINSVTFTSRGVSCPCFLALDGSRVGPVV